MKRAFAALITLIASAAALPAVAQPIVVEVFANQNCAACPKAHANMAKIDAARDDVLILTWSVDYWDYLGAPDPMALPEANARQAAYAERFGLRGPYTPQTVYDGAVQCPGNKIRQVNRQLERRAKTPLPLSFVSGEDGTFTLSGETDAAVDVRLIHIADIPGMPMVNPVLAVDTMDTDLPLAPTCEGRCVLVAQAPGYGEIKAAAWVQ